VAGVGLFLLGAAARFGLAPRMSGSGSACFALLPDGAPVAEIGAAVREAWGATALVVETRLE
jgi:4-diphosphocytidyl-2-C-methyl-D-erythritol kinase